MSDSLPLETIFGLPKPTCCSTGDCCKGASPSVPFYRLWEKAAAGEEFARNFLSIFEPYPSHEAAKAVVPGLAERTLQAAAKSADFNGPEDVVFYRCRNLLPNNLCGVHEDRPQFCRDYPDTPFVVMAPGCAFEDWGQQCRQRYHAMKDNLEALKAVEKSLKDGSSLQDGAVSITTLPDLETLLEQDKAEWLQQENWEAVLSLTPLYISSPYQGYWV